jgi:predicted homoserine dehydrogenase-like protein
MCTSYTDGTKLCVEMALLANAFGMRPTVPGMYGPHTDDIHKVFDVFDFDSLWENRQPLVDYVLGAQPTGGVFAIGYTEHEFQQYTLEWFPPNMGPGPFYLFYRPYHLGHFEAMSTVAEAVLDGHSLLQPDYGFQTNVYAYAKRDLSRGEQLDGIGGYGCYGLIEECVPDDDDPGLPICLAEDVILRRDIALDQRIRMSDIEYDPTRFEFSLYSSAQELVNGKSP